MINKERISKYFYQMGFEQVIENFFKLSIIVYCLQSWNEPIYY